MKNSNRNIPIIMLLFWIIPSFVFSQNATIRGKVIDNEGVEIIGAQIKVINSIEKSTITDIDGNFSIDNLKPGLYEIHVSFISKQNLVLRDLDLKPGVNDLKELRLVDQSFELQAVSVSAQALRNTETAVQTIQKKSINTLDAMSSQTFTQSGDNDAGSALKRITGISVQEGKYVFVRGLGGRYSLTVMNGLSIPGLDPDKNSVELDIFPTNIIDNLLVYKSFTPDLPGSFTGGLIDIQTKDFPISFKSNIGISLGYNPQANLRSGFLDHKGSSTDWISVDDGSRNIPQEITNAEGKLETTYSITNPKDANLLVNSFTKNVSIKNTTKPLNYNINFSVGNQVKLFHRPLGFIAGFTYKRNFTYYDGGITGRYLFISQQSDTLGIERLYKESKGGDDVLLGGIVSSTYRYNNRNKIGFTYLLNSSGKKMTRMEQGYNYGENIGYQEQLLSFQTRSFNTFQLLGNHILGHTNDNSKIDWAVSYSSTKMGQPDLRFLNNAYSTQDNKTEYSIQPSIGLIPTRYWRNMNENTSGNKLDYTYDFKNKKGLKSILKIGLAFDWKSRNFDEHIYQFESLVNTFDGDFSHYLSEANSISSSNPNGVFVTDGSNPKNSYSANSSISAAYGMIEFPISKRLKSIAGLRTEYALMNFTNINYTNVQLMNDLDFLPVLGFIYNIQPDKMNIRLNYNRTLARPAFREIADVDFYEFMNNSFLLGNSDLVRTLVHNIDFRWENFGIHDNKITISGFYKFFTNPIELTNNPEAKNGEWIYTNVSKAEVLGAEFDFSQNLDFIHILKGWSIGGNVSLAKSRASISPEELANIKYHDPDALDTRQLYGQSPYLVNAFISYQNNRGTTARLNYNVQGRRLYLVEIGAKPDVFEEPFNLLNLKISQKIHKRLNISININNLLNDSVMRTIKYKGLTYDFNSYKEGITYGLGFNYDLNK